MSTDSTRSPLTIFLRNRHLLALVLVLSIVAGVSALATMPRLEDPRIVDRNPIILTLYPGASAERVEALVTEPIERALEEIGGIKTIRSTSRSGISSVSVELFDAVGAGQNESIFSEIRDELGDVEPTLPPGAGPPVLDDKRDPVAFTLIVSIRPEPGATASVGLLTRLSEELADRLRVTSGTELVRVYGGVEEEILVEIERAELADLGMTVSDVGRLLDAADSKGSAGVLRSERSDVLLEVEGELTSVERIAGVPLRDGAGGSVVRVGDVASVTRSHRVPEKEIAITEGERAVFVAARMARGARADEWSGRATRVVEEFRALHAGGLVLDVIFDQERYTTGRLLELGGNLLLGALVVALVVWLTMGISQALIVGSALPLVVGVTLMAIQISGNSLHQMSIFGMIIALGLLIDNAIVMTDEVGAAVRKGVERSRAVADSVRHLAGPLGASTITTVLAFSPIVLLPGGAGDFVGSIGQSVIFAVVISYAMSMTVIGALAGLFVPAVDGRRHRWWRDGVSNERVGAAISRGLRALYGAPVAAIALASFLPLSGFALSRTLGNEFFPPVDRDMFHVQIWNEGDSSIAHTRRVVQRAEDVLDSFEGVERTHWLVGGSFPTVWYNLVMDQDSTPSYAQGVVQTVSPEETDRLVSLVQARLQEELPGAQVVVRSFGQGPPVVADIEYRVFGPDLDRLQNLGEQYREALARHPDVLTTRMTIERGEPKLWINADEDNARLAGLALDDIGAQVNAAYEGALGGTVLEQLELMPVRIRFADEQRASTSDIASTPLSSAGDWVPLPAIGDLELRPTRGTITRENGRRVNTMQAYTRDGVLPLDVGREVLQDVASSGLALPTGFDLEQGGAEEQNADATGNLVAYMPLLVTAMIATLILTFRSVTLAGVLALVAVQSVGLALLATWTIQFPISFNTILGTLGLIGVALNDSIVVMASVRAHPTGRTGDPEGIAQAVMGCMRHVISTTLTTIGGFLPLLLLVGGDFWPSLAIVMAGGIAGASILAVLFVPAAYRVAVLLRTVRLPTPTPVPA